MRLLGVISGIPLKVDKSGAFQADGKQSQTENVLIKMAAGIEIFAQNTFENCIRGFIGMNMIRRSQSINL